MRWEMSLLSVSDEDQDFGTSLKEKGGGLDFLDAADVWTLDESSEYERRSYKLLSYSLEFCQCTNNMY